VTLASNAVRRISTAQRDILIKGDIIANLRSFPNHGKTMVDKEALADAGTRMDVVARQKS
jgi:hypothetical protein